MIKEKGYFHGNWKEIPEELFEATSIAIGNFDGVHLGHQKLIKKAIQEAENRNLTSIALTFEPHPLKVLKPDVSPLLLLPLSEKIRIIKFLGIDYIVVLNFSEEFSSLSPEKFAKEVLSERLKAKFVVVGENFRFGKNREGDKKDLVNLGKKLGFDAFIQPAVIIKGLPVSSTRIRRILKEGRIEEAWKLLGRPFKIVGKVIKGKGRGKKLGFPTANINVENELIPKTGVYAVFVEIDEKLLRGVMNIGYNPTFGEEKLSVEVHILDFNEEIYEKKIGVYLIKRLRNESRFANINELIKAIKRDVECAKRILEWDMLSLFYSYFSS